MFIILQLWPRYANREPIVNQKFTEFLIELLILFFDIIVVWEKHYHVFL